MTRDDAIELLMSKCQQMRTQGQAMVEEGNKYLHAAEVMAKEKLFFPCPPDRYPLTLTFNQLQALRDFVGSVTGCSTLSPRKYANELYDLLNDVYPHVKPHMDAFVKQAEFKDFSKIRDSRYQ